VNLQHRDLPILAGSLGPLQLVAERRVSFPIIGPMLLRPLSALDRQHLIKEPVIRGRAFLFMKPLYGSGNRVSCWVMRLD